MKRIIAVILAMVMVCSLAACGEEQKAWEYCGSCGEGISKEAVFCEHCGVEINNTNSESEDSSSNNNSIYETSSSNSEERIPTELDDNLEDYTPTNMGYFDSLEELEEATQRNPNDFKLPVSVSVCGTVARTINDEIYLVDTEKKYSSRLYICEKYGLEEENLKERFVPYRVYMIDDTKNRVLTQDVIVIKGIYRDSTKTFSNCTYEFYSSTN